MILIGDFSETDLKNGNDKKAVEKTKQETGLNYTKTKIIKKGDKNYLRIWICNAAEFTI